MAWAAILSAGRTSLKVVPIVAGITVLFLMYYKSLPSIRCHPMPLYLRPLPRHALTIKQPNSPASIGPLPPQQQQTKPIVLLWFWPENKKFDFQACEKLLNINSCNLTDDQSLYTTAHAVLIFHRGIKDDLSNLPTLPRPKTQRWIWFNTDSPTNTRKIEGIQNLFNLTLNYRDDADIQTRWKLAVRKNTDAYFVLPKKEKLLCWIEEKNNFNETSGERYSYYTELIKHIKVDVFDSSSKALKGKNYFQTVGSCKFVLSFENSVHKDYITEIFYGPLAAGSVPVALGPPRKNYETFVPGTSFIHVNDFPNALTLAEYILKLDEDNKAYKKYFDWWQFYTARRHLTEDNHEFTHAICQACHHVATNKEYRVVRDLYKWFF